MAKFGKNRDGKAGKLQILFGLLTNAEGCPIAVEVFAGKTGDPTTVASQVQKLRDRFMLTEARIHEDLKTAEGIAWITAWRSPGILALVLDGASGRPEATRTADDKGARSRSPSPPRNRETLRYRPLT